MRRIFRRSNRHDLWVVARGRLQAPEGYGSLVSWGALSVGLVAIWSSEVAQAELLGREEPVLGGATFPVTRPASRRAIAIATYLGNPDIDVLMLVHEGPCRSVALLYFRAVRERRGERPRCAHTPRRKPRPEHHADGVPETGSGSDDRRRGPSPKPGNQLRPY